MTTFRFRPHHLICNICFCGKGYNESFIENFKQIHKKLLCSNDNTNVQITDCCDDICDKCPEKQGKKCSHEYKTKKLDAFYLNILQLKIGEVVTFDEIKTKVKKHLTMDAFYHACQKCTWYKLNVCEPIIRKLLNEP